MYGWFDSIISPWLIDKNRKSEQVVTFQNAKTLWGPTWSTQQAFVGIFLVTTCVIPGILESRFPCGLLKIQRK